MKKILFLIVFTFFMHSLTGQVDIKNAEKVAVNFMQRNQKAVNITDIASTEVNKHKGITTTYMVRFKGGGYAVVSASYSVLPILAYDMVDTFDTDAEHAPGLLYWFDVYDKSIYDVLISDTLKNQNSMWDDLLSDVSKPDASLINIMVSPLTQTKWGQNYTNDGDCPGYNYFVPADDYGANCECDKCPTGCGAVAMAQVMRYWAYPVKSGNHTFSWCEMPNELIKREGASHTTPQRAYYEEERDMIAKLLSICGDKVGMNYCISNTCNSFNLFNPIRDALVGDFGYNENAEVRRRQWYTESSWIGYIKSDLNNHRPVIYAAKDTVGQGLEDSGTHSFIVDGYGEYNNNINYFHFNFGWRGKYSNLFMHINHINEFSGSQDYNKLERMINEVYPEEYSYYCSGDITILQWFENSMVAHNLFFAPFAEELKADNISISAGMSVTYSAYSNIELSNFYVDAGNYATPDGGTNFIAKIVPCPYSCPHYVVPAKEYAEKTLLETVPDESILCADYAIRIYPNPANTELNIAYSGEGSVQVQMFDVFGRQVYAGISGRDEWHSSPNGSVHTINTAAYPPGVYLLRLSGTGIGTRSEKIVIAH